MASQLTVALVVLIFDEVKPVGIPQLATVVNDAALLYEPGPNEHTV